MSSFTSSAVLAFIDPPAEASRTGYESIIFPEICLPSPSTSGWFHWASIEAILFPYPLKKKQRVAASFDLQ
ncbi:unnamed protein product [Trifolium pratense]|uniref:Uncharacterized protein n=1 Tax=Trifolium pratense TaxID=57577 RepID=A0ACB0KF41_TRIPR|nr:unnamed protein product [Trifolium pratense]